jgi:uncharacterized membrane protein YkoI
MGIVSSLRRGIFAISLLAWAYLGLPLSAACAQSIDQGIDEGIDQPVDHGRLLAQASGSVGADEAAALVRSVSGGRILDVRLDAAAQPPVYRVKVLLDGGRVRVYRVDARTGRIVP